MLPPGRRPIILQATLWTLAGASFLSVAGTLLLIKLPQVAGLLGSSINWFMKVPTFAYLLAVPAAVFIWSSSWLGTGRALLLAAWGSTVGFAAELLGTTTGVPFGAYSYTEFLGPKLLDHVPLLVPPSWYAMSLLALALASGVTRSALGRVALTAMFMVLWDLALDPAMVAAWPVWVWSDPAGFFYGMPPANLAGWWLTAAVIASGYLVIARVPAGIHPWAAGVWLLSAVLPVGLALARGLWPAVVVGSVAVALPVVTVIFRTAQASSLLARPAATR